MIIKQVASPRVIRWLVVGVVFTGVSVGLLKVMTEFLGWRYIVATFCSGGICMILRFLIVDRWVFGHLRPTWTRLWQYCVANAVGFAIWWAAANVLKSVGVHYLVASVLATFVSVGFSMLSNFF